MRDFAFVEKAPGELVVGWGPFFEAPARCPGRSAFFRPDYFLSDPHPWKHPESWEECSLEEFVKRLSRMYPAASSARVDWKTPDVESYAELFASAHGAIVRGEFKKIVPVFFEEGRLGCDPRRFVGTLLAHLTRVPRALRVYGFVSGSVGMIGASPELLFEREATGYRTMALAGTRPIAVARELLEDPKELAEHGFVTEDILRRLEPYGAVEAGALEILEMPRIAHLMTRIRFRPHAMASAESPGHASDTFMDMVRRLHPTAALGVWPRNGVGRRWLAEADRGVKRGGFGAPFGFESDDGRAVCLVAIRNVSWSGEQVRVGSGSGLLLESRFEREWHELRNKREQVKGLFGLASQPREERSLLVAVGQPS